MSLVKEEQEQQIDRIIKDKAEDKYYRHPDQLHQRIEPVDSSILITVTETLHCGTLIISPAEITTA